MTPGRFVALAAVTAICVTAAIFAYMSSLRWSHAMSVGASAFGSSLSEAPAIGQIEVDQGDSKLTLDRQGQGWVVREHNLFPASAAKVSAFLRSLAEAKLVEAKTRQKDRYALLGLEDPKSAGAKSRLMRLTDDKGRVVAELILGNQRSDAFGTGKSGTYIRKPGEDQTWLVSTKIDADVGLKNWVESRLFDVRLEDVRHLTVKLPNEDALNIDQTADGSRHVLSNIPDGMKLKYADVPDDIIAVATALNFDDVRKSQRKPGDDNTSSITWELKNGLAVTLHIERDGDVAWLSVDAAGEGEAKAEADALLARTAGWEFRISKSNADAILPHRADILEKVSS